MQIHQQKAVCRVNLVNLASKNSAIGVHITINVPRIEAQKQSTFALVYSGIGASVKQKKNQNISQFSEKQVSLVGTYTQDGEDTKTKISLGSCRWSHITYNNKKQVLKKKIRSLISAQTGEDGKQLSANPRRPTC